jgi:hypothetical protein
MIDRRERPSSIVRPEPNFAKMESAWARIKLLIFRCRALAMTP